MPFKRYLMTGILLPAGLILALLQAPDAGSQPGGLPVLRTKPRVVAAFKNGLAFFVREGEVSPENGWAMTEQVPDAALGSFWIGTLSKESEVEEAVGLKQKVLKETEALSLDEILRANKGKDVILFLGEKSIEGRIKALPDEREAAGDEIPGRNYDPYSQRSYLQTTAPSLVVLETKNGDVALSRSLITRIDLPRNSRTTFTSGVLARNLKFKVRSPEKKVKMTLSYLQKGLSWVPSYLVNIQDPKKARITMKAVIVNDIEDLNDADVYFIVGFPNFLHADILSPLAMRESIQQFIQTLTSGRRYEAYDRNANIMVQQRAVPYSEEERDTGLDYSYEAMKGLPGSTEEDLFLYNKKGVNLKKGERGYYPIFSDLVEYRHIYEWDVPNTTDVDLRGYSVSQDSARKEREPVWHSIRLVNSTPYPWTTASALTISDWKPLAQDMITYTPRGSKANLKLTVANDIKTDREEEEASRQRDIRMYQYSYDLVTVKGELVVRNLKDREVTMLIKKTLTGEVTEASHKGRIEKNAEGLKGVNYNSVISWETQVPAGKEEKLTYKYRVYVNH